MGPGNPRGLSGRPWACRAAGHSRTRAGSRARSESRRHCARGPGVFSLRFPTRGASSAAYFASRPSCGRGPALERKFRFPDSGRQTRRRASNVIMAHHRPGTSLCRGTSTASHDHARFAGVDSDSSVDFDAIRSSSLSLLSGTYKTTVSVSARIVPSFTTCYPRLAESVVYAEE